MKREKCKVEMKRHFKGQGQERVSAVKIEKKKKKGWRVIGRECMFVCLYA